VEAEAAAARAAWNNMKNTSDPAELQDFMRRYPDSPLAVHDAKLRIELLDRQAKEREAKAHTEAAAREAKARAEAEMAQVWNNTKDSHDPADFKSFIKRYPNSPFTSDAKQRLAAIEPAVRAKPEVEKRHEVASPPPPKAKEKVASRHREEPVETPRRQRERPEREARPASRPQPTVHYQAVMSQPASHSGTMSGVGF
jgi:hypothetical protein